MEKEKKKNRMSLSEALEQHNCIREFLLFQNRHAELPVVLWGGGAACRYFIEFMRKYSIPVRCIIDQNEPNDSIEVLTPEEAYVKYEKAIVVISAIAHKDEIRETISGKYNDYIFCFDPTLEILQQRSFEERRNYFAIHEKELGKLRDELSDKCSQMSFDSVIAGAFTNNPDCYKYSSSKSQYFPEVIKKNLSDEEVFVDIGAFTGDSIEQFILAVNNKYKKIYAFEPERSNIREAKAIFCDARIDFYQNGVGKESGTLYLTRKGEASHCDVTGDEAAEKVEVVKLDDVIQEKITYIKMDIEGMELDALKGAEGLIRRYKPKLAICVYHKMEDMVEIPAYIRSLHCGYHFYLRHYWDCNGTDVVLFAV